MLNLSDLNVLAIIVAWLISVGLGSFWYSPVGFGKLWSKLSAVDMMKIPKEEANKAIASVIVSSLVQAITLAIIVNTVQPGTAGNGFVLGLVLWAGFTAATTVGNNLYSRLSWKFWWLNASFFLIIMPINAIIFTVWQ